MPNDNWNCTIHTAELSDDGWHVVATISFGEGSRYGSYILSGELEGEELKAAIAEINGLSGD